MDADRRAELESWITEEVPVIREFCRAFRIPLAAWPSHPSLSVFVDLAVSRAVDEYIVTLRARSETHALQLIAPRYGIKPDTLRRRFQRHRTAGKDLRQLVPQPDARAA